MMYIQLHAYKRPSNENQSVVVTGSLRVVSWLPTGGSQETPGLGSQLEVGVQGLLFSPTLCFEMYCDGQVVYAIEATHIQVCV